MKIKLFSSINNTQSSKHAMLAAAAAVGITLSLGTPIAGVLFSMEVTSSIYTVSNLVKALATSSLCIFISRLLNGAANMNLFNAESNLPTYTLGFDIVFMIILGIICGLIGAMLSTIVTKLAYIRRKTGLTLLNNRFYYAATAAVIISSITFTVKPLMIFDRKMLSYIFQAKLPNEFPTGDMNHPNEGILLLVLFGFKFVTTVLSQAINMPAGIFAPFFMLGAYFGRMYGHVLSYFLGTGTESLYAMVGAACVMSGATHSISSAIIIFELTGQSSYLIPMLAACLIANLTAQSISMSFFDVILLLKNLPHLPSIKTSSLYNLTAKDVMSTDIYRLENLTYMNALELLFSIPDKHYDTIPIIDQISGTIRYTIKSRKIAKYLFNLFESYKLNYEVEIQNRLFNVITYLRRKHGKKHSGFLQYLNAKVKKICMTSRDKERRRASKAIRFESYKEDLEWLKGFAVNDDLLLNSRIDEEDKVLRSEKSALTISHQFSCLKIHFMFTFLNISNLYVYDENNLVGVITKEGFVKKSMVIG
jgi:H+/Cl- antiporter ClcA